MNIRSDLCSRCYSPAIASVVLHDVHLKKTLDDGAPKDIRVLSSNCPVSTESELVDHGMMSAGENLDWFRSVIENENLSDDAREEALFGLVQSGSDAAFDYLDRLLSHR